MTGTGVAVPKPQQESRSLPLAELMHGRVRGVVAEELGISRHRLNRLLSGAEMRVSEVVSAARYFRVPLETFLPGGTKDGDER